MFYFAPNINRLSSTCVQKIARVLQHFYFTPSGRVLTAAADHSVRTMKLNLPITEAHFRQLMG